MVTTESDIAFREGCIEACEAILHSDINVNSAFLTEKHIRERLIEYTESLAAMRQPPSDAIPA